VDYLWWLSDVPVHLQERIVPTGTQELVINLETDAFDIRGVGDDGVARRYSGAMVSGAYGKHFIIDTRAHADLLGVHFKPGAAGAILGVPPGKLADQHVDLDLLWGRPARELRERLGNISSTQQRFRIVETELLSRLRGSLGVHPAIAIALRELAAQGTTLADIARALGLTNRSFIQLFTAEVGMTPKLYGRVQRFQSALTRAQRTTPNWAGLALQAGYCDQSHLIRDFVSFSGFSPNELLRHTVPELKEHHLTDSSKIHPIRP